MRSEEAEGMADRRGAGHGLAGGVCDRGCAAVGGPDSAAEAFAAAGRLSKPAAWLLKQCIGLERIQPGKPQQNGWRERMHQVRETEPVLPPTANQLQQQVRYHRFRHEFNHVRPHTELAQRQPATVFAHPARAYPEQVPDPEYP